MWRRWSWKITKFSRGNFSVILEKQIVIYDISIYGYQLYETRYILHKTSGRWQNWKKHNRQKAPPTLPSGKTNKVKSLYICIVKDTLNKHKVVKAKM